ncbi:MAG: RHS repeat-associated core domain-containing protein, partial [Chloroflexota bacterium]
AALRFEETLQYIYTDHLGSANTLVDQSGSQTNTRFMPFGEIRSGGSELGDLTERGFTGHRENREIGLTYMNARYYVPGIGRFASADTIVPNPVNPQSQNRYSYVYNSPLNYTDPSGHIAICFNGGPAENFHTEDDGNTANGNFFNETCRNALIDAGYIQFDDNGNEITPYGDVHILRNGTKGIDYAMFLIQEMVASGSLEPIIVIGHSWGGAAGLVLADRLDQVNIPVDLLFLIDPEINGRKDVPRSPNTEYGRRAIYGNGRVSDNVRRSIMVDAEFPNPRTQPGLIYVQDGTAVIDNIDLAFVADLSDHISIAHPNSRHGQQTREWISIATAATLRDASHSTYSYSYVAPPCVLTQCQQHNRARSHRR